MTKSVHWTELKELRDQGATDRQLARHYGISKGTIWYNLGPRGENVRWRPEDDEYLRAHYKHDMSASEIGRELGFSRNSVIGRAFRLNLGKAAA